MTARPLVIGLTAVNFVFVLIVLAQDGPAARQSQSQESVLRAQAIELVDGNGQVRAQLNVQSGEAIFRLRDSTGAVRVKLGASQTGSGLLLLNHATEPGVHILAKRSGSSLTLKNTGGRRRLIKPPPPSG